ncbi:MAG: NAD-dependent epimerase/dehydratase family protein [Candidatus Limnocylindria bacterium]
MTIADDFRGARALVVGGAGFVGGNLVRTLVNRGAADVMVVDNLLSSNRTAVLDLPQVTFVRGSIANPQILAELANDLDFVFHLATFHGNQNSMADPSADHSNNLLTTLRLYQGLIGFGRLRKVVYASAGCTVARKVYGAAEPTLEDDPVSLDLDSPYQISKVVGEMYGNYFHSRHGLPVVHARFQNVYGPGEILGAGRWRGTPATVWRNVTPTFVYRAIVGLPLVLENGGRSSRDFIYVDDIVDGLLRCAVRGQPAEAYNLASGVETTIRELADAINACLPRPAPIEMAPRRSWDHSGNRLGSTVKARNRLGFKAKVTLDEGIGRTVAWTQENLPMIEASIRRHRRRLAAA